MLNKISQTSFIRIFAIFLLLTGMQVHGEDQKFCCEPNPADCCEPYSLDCINPCPVDCCEPYYTSYEPCCKTNECYDQCLRFDRGWISAEYLGWVIQNSPNPTPLVFEGAPLVTDPGAVILLGGKNIDTRWRSGLKGSLGYWFNNTNCFGAEASYFFLPNRKNNRTVSSDGSVDSNLLLVPIFDVATGSEESFPISVPGEISGQATLQDINRMQGGEINLLASLPSFWGLNLTALGGFRYWNYNEGLSLFTKSTLITTGDFFDTVDHFHTENNFYGGQVGFILAFERGKFFLNAKGKVAFGTMNEKLTIDGLINIGIPPIIIATFPGGYFALPTNIGKHSQNKFAVLPEVNFNFGYQIFDYLSVEIGYTFIYVNNVLYAGDQIENRINPTQSVLYTKKQNPVLIGEAAPTARFKTASLWVQGLNVGFQLKF